MSEKKETTEMTKLKEIWETMGKTDTAKASEMKGADKMAEAAETANAAETMKEPEETEKMPDGKEGQTEGKLVNEMRLCFLSRGENESLARIAVAGFIAWLDPTLDVLDDIRTAVSEAVTNAIIHGYQGKQDGIVYLSAFLYEQAEACHMLRVDVEDTGTGIEDVQKAMEPLYSTSPDSERAGMGFAFMKAFTDCLEVDSKPQLGTCVSMWKRLFLPEASHDAG